MNEDLEGRKFLLSCRQPNMWKWEVRETKKLVLQLVLNISSRVACDPGDKITSQVF